MSFTNEVIGRVDGELVDGVQNVTATGEAWNGVITADGVQNVAGLSQAAQVDAGGKIVMRAAGKLNNAVIKSGGVLDLDDFAIISQLTVEHESGFVWNKFLAGTEILNCTIAGQSADFAVQNNVVSNFRKLGGSLYIGDGVTVKNLYVKDLEYNTFSCSSSAVIDGITFDCAGFGNNAVAPQAAANVTLLDGWMSWGGDINGLTINQKSGGNAYLMTSGGGTVSNPGKTITLTNVNLIDGGLYLGEVNVNGHWDGDKSNNPAAAVNVNMSGGTLYFRNGTIKNLNMSGGTIILADRGLYAKGEAPVYKFEGSLYLRNATIQSKLSGVDLVVTTATRSVELNNTKLYANIVENNRVMKTVISGVGTEVGDGYAIKTDSVEFNLKANWFAAGSSINNLEAIQAKTYRISARAGQGDYILGNVSGVVSDLVITQALLDETEYNLKYKIAGPMPSVDYITIHNTANNASAMNERDYLNRRTDNAYISFHYAVDETHAVQILEHDVHGWHAGDGRGNGNMKSIGVEICRSTDYSTDRYYKAEENAVKLAAYLLYEFNLTVDDLRMHQDWSGKYCPHRILDEGTWESFKKRVSEVRLSMPVFRVNFGGKFFNITTNEVVEVDGFLVTMKEVYNYKTKTTQAKLTVRTKDGDNASLNWNKAWSSSAQNAVKYVNILSGKNVTVYLGNAMENKGGNGVYNVFGTISTGGNVDYNINNSVIFGGSATQEIATSWLKVTGGEGNSIYGGGDGQNMTDGTNVEVSDGVTKKIYGGGKDAVTMVGGNNVYAVNLAVLGGIHAQIHGGSDNGKVSGDIALYVNNIRCSSVLTGAGSGSVNGNIMISINHDSADNATAWTANIIGGGVTLNSAIAVSGNIVLKLNSGMYQGIIYGGNRAQKNYTADMQGIISVTVKNIEQFDNVKLLAQGTSAWIVGAGQAVSGGVLTANEVNLYVSSAKLGNIVGGAQAEADSQTTVQNINVEIGADSEITANIFAAGYARGGGLSMVNGNVNLHIDSTQGTVSIMGNIYAGGNNPGGRGAVKVNGGAAVIFSGSSDNLSFNGTVSGLGKGNCEVTGSKTLGFADFSGDFNGTIENFEVIKLSGNTIMSIANGFSTANMVFELTKRTESEAFLTDAGSINLLPEESSLDFIIGQGEFAFALMDVADEDLTSATANIFDRNNILRGSFNLLDGSLLVDGIEVALNIADNGLLSISGKAVLA